MIRSAMADPIRRVSMLYAPIPGNKLNRTSGTPPARGFTEPGSALIR
jgi:hypothetical protein